MTLETEAVLDRRRLRRSLSLWRIGAVVAAALALIAFAVSGQSGDEATPSAFSKKRQIARVTLEGVITENRDQLRLLQQLADAKHVEAVVLYINSPGGTTAGGEALYEAIRKISDKKPVVAQFGTVATSAAYICGLATDQIFARGNTITGSVGVIFQWAEVSELMAKLGVKMNEIKSGPLKATPSPFQPLEEEGRVFSGREAVRFKLADQIGGEAEAVKWLEEERKVQKGLRIVDWRPRRDTAWPLGALAEVTSGGITTAAKDAARAVLEETGLSAIRLDGLVSVWHPGKN